MGPTWPTLGPSYHVNSGEHPRKNEHSMVLKMGIMHKLFTFGAHVISLLVCRKKHESFFHLFVHMRFVLKMKIKQVFPSRPI